MLLITTGFPPPPPNALIVAVPPAGSTEFTAVVTPSVVYGRVPAGSDGSLVIGSDCVPLKLTRNESNDPPWFVSSTEAKQPPQLRSTSSTVRMVERVA